MNKNYPTYGSMLMVQFFPQDVLSKNWYEFLIAVFFLSKFVNFTFNARPVV